MPPARAAAPAEARTAPLVARLDAAEEEGAVDARQLADALGVPAGRVRAALAAPAALTDAQAAAVARALGVDAAAMRALRRGPAAAAASTLALLEAVLAGVRPDAAGVALRRAALDAAGEAGRAAGRALPPGAHALRDPAVPADGAVLGAAPSDAPPQDDAADAAHAAGLVAELQRTTPGYDDLFAPLHDDALGDLIARHALALHAAPGVPAGTRFVLTPPLYGRRRLVLAAAAAPDQRRLVVRAALAACAAGHADEGAAPLPSPAPEPLARVCDAVALADLVPFWQVADLRRRGRLGWTALAAHISGVVARLAGDWDARRTADRAALRVALFRAHQL